MELKPCPFCGGGCCVCSISYEDGEEYRAHCMDCDCQITVDTENRQFLTHDAAANAWNTRVKEA